MKLFEHQDFRDVVIAAAARFDLPEQFVEKDYYVTEVLRIASETLPGHVIFKGGTSLSKGWHLLERFLGLISRPGPTSILSLAPPWPPNVDGSKILYPTGSGR